jgi:pimeloyl-ACP methyl ester carboxylesterase
LLIHGYTVTSTVNFATHYTVESSGRLVVTPGPTVESALVGCGYRVVMFDLRGHGRSDKPHDADRYGAEGYVGDVRALVDHLQLGDPAVVGYSLGAMIAAHLLDDPAFRAIALCGTGSFHVKGEPGSERLAELDDVLATCFLDDAWDDHPEAKPYRAFARLDGDADFLALGAAARRIPLVPKAALVSPKMPVLVLNGGGDLGAAKENDLARLIPGARRAVGGDSDHGTAPSDPLFQRELTRFLLDI